MKYGVIGDVHSNIEALTSVLADIDAAGVDQVVCFGDLVGYYANPNEVVDMFRQRNVRSVAGNHDRMAIGALAPSRCTERARRSVYWTRERLSAGNAAYLASLPQALVVDEGFLLVHASLRPEPSDEEALLSVADATLAFRGLADRWPGVALGFFGHTHRRAMHEWRDRTVRALPVQETALSGDARHLINPGSVALSRDGDPRASFAVFDTDGRTVQFHRVAYDAAESEWKAKRAGLLHRDSRLRRTPAIVLDALRWGGRAWRAR